MRLWCTVVYEKFRFRHTSSTAGVWFFQTPWSAATAAPLQRWFFAESVCAWLSTGFVSTTSGSVSQVMSSVFRWCNRRIWNRSEIHKGPLTNYITQILALFDHPSTYGYVLASILLMTYLIKVCNSYILLNTYTVGPREIKQNLKNQGRDLRRVNGYDSRIPNIYCMKS